MENFNVESRKFAKQVVEDRNKLQTTANLD